MNGRTILLRSTDVRQKFDRFIYIILLYKNLYYGNEINNKNLSSWNTAEVE